MWCLAVVSPLSGCILIIWFGLCWVSGVRCQVSGVSTDASRSAVLINQISLNKASPWHARWTGYNNTTYLKIRIIPKIPSSGVKFQQYFPTPDTWNLFDAGIHKGRFKPNDRRLWLTTYIRYGGGWADGISSFGSPRWAFHHSISQQPNNPNRWGENTFRQQIEPAAALMKGWSV